MEDACICFRVSGLFSGSGFAAETVPVFVSIVPQKYFVQQIGKELVDVQVMVQPGASPASYEPKPQQMTALAKSKIYFAVGVPFEKAWLEKIAASNTDMQVVRTDHDVDKLAMAAHHHDEHEGEHHESDHDHDTAMHHGEAAHDGDHHEHAGLDPHVWLSPSLVKIQARSILAALVEADPAHKSVYEANYQAFAQRIDRLDADLKEIFAGKEACSSWSFIRPGAILPMPTV